ncbi:MAG: fumarylacetoacetate hydrolase family protein [Betaproteobacteria bacterium]|nr:fumarylacetoacetate hydrolase family protein [Betaproteobacteria bacterium]MBK8863293.1 fumarylacetoacetate hydrolase family protein [Betaproteobacteria bacterium]MBK9682190.1 fumarylacetoacetate hydrolase family protein [Betaproteobacteria bacterium]MBP6318048.1 fumarylacetoacetate hydrolase family protein [Rubrivivax sp.]MBP6465804.1 fumarylacetoacetate hydrolase family protein [Rubrivivax sp.]
MEARRRKTQGHPPEAKAETTPCERSWACRTRGRLLLPVAVLQADLLDERGQIRDLSGLPMVPQGTLAVPWAGMPIPKEPIVFTKTVDSAVGCHHAVVLLQGSVKSDWEVGLGVVIGTRARHVSEADALAFVAGYCVVNDISERQYQLERGGQWNKGKGCDAFGPVDPWLVTADEVGDPQNLALWLDLNGQRRQTGHTETMIFGMAQPVSYLSRFMTLIPGDLITTGTPPGVGMGVKPAPVYLQPGDVMELGIDKLGTQRQTVHAWDPALVDG